MKSFRKIIEEIENKDIEFAFYQEMLDGKQEPMYHIPIENSKNRSTVSVYTLRKNNLKVPYTPSFEEWKRNRK